MSVYRPRPEQAVKRLLTVSERRRHYLVFDSKGTRLPYSAPEGTTAQSTLHAGCAVRTRTQTPTARVALPKVTLGVRGAVAPQPSCHDDSAAAGQGAGLRLSRAEQSRAEQSRAEQSRAEQTRPAPVDRGPCRSLISLICDLGRRRDGRRRRLEGCMLLAVELLSGPEYARLPSATSDCTHSFPPHDEDPLWATDPDYAVARGGAKPPSQASDFAARVPHGETLSVGAADEAYHGWPLNHAAMRHPTNLDAGKREIGGEGANGATVSQSCLASHCLGSEQVTNAGKGSVWDAVSDLFMQPHVSAGFWWWTK
ncbi:hypothetical protein LA080_016341 [Diaporthe eres]|nr:hypothetical protein LA080_016341 [Diaporthe eres]